MSTQQAIPRHGRRDVGSDEDEDGDVEMGHGGGGGEGEGGSESLARLSKGLVRYALACEHARKPIKRQDINEKVLGSHSRLFKSVFQQANSDLMDVFGMQMAELPKAERVTIRQKRAAAASESQSKSSSMWILQSLLPEEYRVAEIVGPSRPLDEQDTVSREDSYVGLYSMVIALITISGGKMPEGKLDRALRRMNADQTTPVGSKDKTLAAMVKDGYLVRVKETAAGQDETVEYIVGPRGKVEVGREGVAQLVRTMYGDSEDHEELEKRIQRMMDVADANSGGGGGGGGGSGSESVGVAASQAVAVGRKRGRPRNDEGG